MLRLCILVVCCLQLHAQDYGLINLCRIQYVEPGADFQMDCRSEYGAATRIFLPSEEVPSDATLNEISNDFEEESKKTITINQYDDATEEDSGIYTCVVYHGPGVAANYSIATCEVIIADLCADAGCTDGATCTANYDTGTAECECQYDCAQTFDPLCTDTCEMLWNDCALEEAICLDKKPREVAHRGFCPELVEPTTRKLPGVQQVVADVGESVILASGLVQDGTPIASVTWIFYPEEGEAQEIENVRETYEFVADTNFAGDYEISIMHCKNHGKTVVNRYSVSINNEAEEPTATPTPELDNLVTGAYHVCSIYPAGALESFSGAAVYYDLACTHVLVADVLAGGDYSNPWFIYGTFDQHDGKGALMAMAFYLGTSVFEFQRGWIINLNGEKMLVDEGVIQQVGDSDCYVVFENMHLNLDCPYFEAYYDGIMSGHVRLKGERTVEEIAKGRGNFGMCFDNVSGWRKNWQVGSTTGQCEVSRDAAACPEEEEGCDLYQAPLIPAEWAACGTGAVVSCNELGCGGDVASSAQTCALKQAARVSCALKYGQSVAGQEAECPENGCDWKVDVMSRGCPQEDPPFVCP